MAGPKGGGTMKNAGQLSISIILLLLLYQYLNSKVCEKNLPVPIYVPVLRETLGKWSV